MGSVLQQRAALEESNSLVSSWFMCCTWSHFPGYQTGLQPCAWSWQCFFGLQVTSGVLAYLHTGPQGLSQRLSL